MRPTASWMGFEFLKMNNWRIYSLLLALAASLPVDGRAQLGANDGQWRHYGADIGSTKYSSLSQIDASNFEELEIAWRWKSLDERFDLEKLKEDYPKLQIENDVASVSIDRMRGAPLIVDGIAYMLTAMYQAAAIDAITGETLWTYDPKAYASGIPTTRLAFSSRGLAYWSDGEEARALWGTGDGNLVSVNAHTGVPDEEFGNGGRVDLVADIPRASREAPINYSVTSAPIVVGDVVVVGSAVTDQPDTVEMPPGYVRGFDVRTGELRWTFHTIPRRGEYGYETWAPGTAEVAGGANVWSLMSADEELGLVYLPIAAPGNDFFGAHRLGDNLFANSLVAVDVSTGERRWHFQMVHHDLWDSDPAAAPNLLDINVDGERIKAVAQPAKTGFVYVFDRETGEPVWPIEEREVPESDIPGEEASATQPFPTKPPAFERQGLTTDDLIDFTPELRRQAEEVLTQHRHGQIFTPPSLRGDTDGASLGTLHLPSYIGGANWHGAAADPETGLLYVPSITRVSRSALTKPEHEDATLQYVRDFYRLLNVGPQGLPLVKPPYGRITAIDLNAGTIAWQKANGPGSPRVRLQPALAGLDMPDLGGGWDHLLLTKTLLICGQAGPNRENKSVLVARDKATGKAVGEIVLPARVQGPPVTYLANGKQYIAMSVAGSPPEVIALRLPDD